MHFFKSSSGVDAPGQEGKHAVSWCPSVIDNHCKFGSLRTPVMINSHEVINIRLKDVTWNVCRRYSDFEALHEGLVAESVLSPEELPSLPKKRWFELNRWTQRNEEEYTKERRGELQKYLQVLLKLEGKLLLQKSKVLQSFLEFHQLVAALSTRREMLDCSEGDTLQPDDDVSCENDEEEVGSRGGSDGRTDMDEDRAEDSPKETQGGGGKGEARDRSGSFFDMFSLSTSGGEGGGGGGNSSEVDSPSPSPSPARSWSSGLSKNPTPPPAPLKGCLEQSKYREGEEGNGEGHDSKGEEARLAAEAAEDKRRAEGRQSSGGIDAFKELKDFVKILIL